MRAVVWKLRIIGAPKRSGGVTPRAAEHRTGMSEVRQYCAADGPVHNWWVAQSVGQECPTYVSIVLQTALSVDGG